MGFMDKVKETAAKGGEMAKGAAKAGQDKLDETKTKKKLGGVVYAQKTGTGTGTGNGTADAEIERLVGEIKDAEDELASIGAETAGDGDGTAETAETPATTESGTAPA
jgi:hypothetical protein